MLHCFACVGNVGWEAGGTPVPLCQLCGGDTGEKLKQMNGVMTSETTGARFAGVHILGAPG